jgi:hypothetical protein
VSRSGIFRPQRLRFGENDEKNDVLHLQLEDKKSGVVQNFENLIFSCLKNI